VPDISLRIEGLDELVRALGGQDMLDHALRPGFNRAGAIVEGAWKQKVHVVTRKYQSSIGYEVTGHGASIATHIGPRPGLGQPRHYSKSSTGRWRKPRDGVNRGDPQVYAKFEDQGTRYRPGHPAAEPALAENADRIVDGIRDGFAKSIEKAA
jgi:hypothetical protein